MKFDIVAVEQLVGKRHRESLRGVTDAGNRAVWRSLTVRARRRESRMAEVRLTLAIAHRRRFSRGSAGSTRFEIVFDKECRQITPYLNRVTQLA